MIYYRIKDFFRSRVGQVTLLALAVTVRFLLLTNYLRKREEEQEQVVSKLPSIAEKTAWGASNISEKSPLPEKRNDFIPSEKNDNFRLFYPAPPKPRTYKPVTPPKPIPEVVKATPTVFPLPSIIQFERPIEDTPHRGPILLPPQEPQPPKAPSLDVEEGTLLYCELSSPVFSDQADAPVLARLTRPLIRGDKTILPSGTNLSGTLQRTHGNRFFFAPEWRVKLPSGAWVPLKAQAQEAALDHNSGDYLANDGRTGLPGFSATMPEKKKTIWKKALGKAVVAAGKLGQDQTRTAIGEYIPGTARNTVIRGTSDVIEHYTNRPETNEPKRQNPLNAGAGSQFYLVVIAD